jgi:hypothetical protein
MKTRSFVAAALLLVAGAALSPRAAAAQVFTPTFMAPRQASDVGVYLSDVADLALEGIFRQRFGAYDLGFRVGVVDAGDASLTLGGELRNPLVLGTAPLDLAFTAGAQALIGDFESLGAQAGLSIGYTFVSPEVSFTPYVHPRIAFIDPELGESDLEVLADLGVDVALRQNLTFRLGIALDDTAADWGIGLAWRR